jgi:hypothetical protein
MGRVVIALLIGATVGGGAVAVARFADRDVAGSAVVVDASQLAVETDTRVVDTNALLTGARNVEARSDVLQAIAAANIAGLPVLIWELADRPQSAARDYALAAAVRRLAEYGAGQALAVLNQTFLDPQAARKVALIVLEQLEPEAASVDFVLASLPQIDAYRFQIDAVETFAAASVESALAYTLTFGGRAQRERALATASPLLLEKLEETFAFVDTIANSERRFQFETRLLAELASIDRPAATALFAERFNDAGRDRDRAVMETVRALYTREPETAVALLDSLGTELRGAGWMRAARAWQARTNPEAGMAFAEQPSRNRDDRVRQTVATVLAEQDPDRTIAWLRSLDPMPADVAEGVIGGVARVDPLRAIDLGEELGFVGALDRVDTLAQSASLIAERVLTVQDLARRNAWLESLLQGWNGIDAVAATDWAFANAERLSSEMFERLGRRSGANDPAAALQNAMRLPEAAAQPWVDSVVRGAMGPDPAAALDWVAQFRGQPFYDLAAASVVSSGIWTDIPPVREVFDTLSMPQQAKIAQRFVMTWHQADQTAAQAWVTSMPPNAVRDEALTGLLRFRGYELDNDALLDLFSSDQARASAVVAILDDVMRRDPAVARTLVDTYVEDPALREKAELLLASPQLR